VDVAEFDRFAEEYTSTHADNIRISGEDPAYFARYKIEEVRRRWDAERRPEPAAVLDFGTGIGNSLPHLARLFPSARVTGLDVSQKSLDVAAVRFPGAADLVRHDGAGALPFADATFDLIFSACVFHHIEAGEHAAIFAELKRVLKPGGLMTVFEHNPVNPVTRHIVATCPFDENAVLLASAELKARQTAAGFRGVKVAYTGFFPGAPNMRYSTSMVA
jgi:ubiquinone/menaquinone biosynthesis C-methylase UbiE